MRRWPLVVLLAGVVLEPAQAQRRSARVEVPELAVATAVRAEAGAPRIDGRMDEAAWAAAPVIGGFVQQEPNEGQPGTERTEARVVYTDQALYVGVRAYDSRAETIAAQLTRRDDDSPSDWIGICIDSYRDRRTAFEFAVNPAGVKRDAYRFNDGDVDNSWDGVWEVATTRDAQGWTAEFKIPFSQLRFASAPQLAFGFNVYRKLNRLNEVQQWKLIPRNASGNVSHFGDLIGISGIRPPRRVEIQPYSVGQASSSAPEAGNPFRTGTTGHATMGADFKYGLTSNLTLSATVNPDFGQVEADPAVVNLSAFETFFQEKRPFFNEGLDIFQFRLGGGDGNSQGLFYTRRIGRAPQGEADPRGGYAQELRHTTILGAAKISGKTPSGWTIGLTGALTGQEDAGVVDSLGRSFRDAVEPRTTYLVGRLAKEVRSGATQLGIFGTAVDRALPASLDFLRSSAFTAGVDFNHQFRRKTYYVSGWIVGSQVFGSPNAINETQRSSSRYFQRPDNDYVTYDSTRISLGGFAANLVLGKQGGGSWRFATGVDTRSPGFEVNDAGYQRSVDWHGQFVWINKRWLTPGKVFRRVGVNFNQWSNFDYGWNRTQVGGNVNWNFQLKNYWEGYSGGGPNLGGLASDPLRGGPGFIRPTGWNGWGGFSSDRRRAFRAGVSGWFFRQNAKDTHSEGVTLNLSYRPAANIDLDLSPQVNRTTDAWQYLTTATVLGRDEYIFGELKQRTVSTTFRGNLTFTPSLSLQLYAEPFVSAGAYGIIKRVLDPRAATFAGRFDELGADRLSRTAAGDLRIDLNRDGTSDIGIDNPDFTVLSFRSNVVLRWEYRPGSTLFFVWQHGRSGSSTTPRFDVAGDVSELFRSPADNTFLIKLNYWWSL